MAQIITYVVSGYSQNATVIVRAGFNTNCYQRYKCRGYESLLRYNTQPVVPEISYGAITPATEA